MSETETELPVGQPRLVMPLEMFRRFGSKGENWGKMDYEIRKLFKVPSNRYYSVTVPPSPPGRVFVDSTRTLIFVTPKLSKSDAPA